MKYRHYAPKAPVTVVRGDPADAARYIRRHLDDGDGVICFNEFVPLFEGHPVSPSDPRTTWRSRPGGCSTPCGTLTAPT